MKPKFLYCKTWMANVWFFIGWKPEDVKKYWKHEGVSEIVFDGYGGKFFRVQKANGNIIYSIWTRYKPTKPRHRATLAHEILHCVNSIMNDKGVVACWVNDEPAAYLTSEITEAAYE
jgi:hypothetical protein